MCSQRFSELVGRSRSCLLLVCLLAGIVLSISCGDSSSPQAGSGVTAAGKIPLPDLGPAEPWPVVVERTIPIPREGEEEPRKLFVDVYRPSISDRIPTLLVATAYRRELMERIRPSPRWLASRGYGVVLLDVMGTGSSEGGWESFSSREIDDIVWVVDHWIPEQDWSNGKVGMYGPSYMGIAACLTAARRPRHLKAVFPGVAAADVYRDIFFQGGIFDQEFILPWAMGTLELSLIPGTQLFLDPASARKALREHRQQVPLVLSWMEKNTEETFFRERSPMTYWGELAELPVFFTAGWLDIFTRGSLLNYSALAEEAQEISQEEGCHAGPKRLIVGPWYHLDGAFMEGLPADILHKRWFDWHLKADEDPNYRNYDILDPTHPVTLYVQGREQWRQEKAWPLARARYRRLYLSGERQAADRNESLNNGSLSWGAEEGGHWSAPADEEPTRIAYDPRMEASRFAGTRSNSSCRWIMGLTRFLPSARDERENEEKVLTFSTAPLDEDVEVTGPAVLRLYARSTFGPPCSPPPAIWFRWADSLGVDLSPLVPWAQQTDLHWVVHLNDVFPDGRVQNLTSGWLAASHRPDPARPDWTRQGYDPSDYPEDEHPLAPRDGRIYEYVIEVWPTCNVFKAGHQIRIDIANTDFPHLLPSLVPSKTEIFHDASHPSRLLLPIVPSGSTAPDQWIDDPKAYFSGETPWN